DVVRALAFAFSASAVLVAMPLSDATPEGASVPWLYAALLACAMLVGTAEVFRDNAAQTLMPSIVAHDQLESANGRLWSVELVGNSLLGPALGAFLIAAVLWTPFAFNAAAFALSALLILGVAGPFRPPVRETRDWRTELREGVQFLWSAPLLPLLAVVTGVWNLLHQMVVIALVLHVQENLGLGARAYGLILAAGAIGGILGGLLAERVIRALGQGATAQWMTCASAVAFAAIPLAPNGWTLAVILAAFEFTGLTWNTVSVSYRQRFIPDALLGRVNSVYRLLAWGMMPVGLVLAGLVMSWTEPVIGRSSAVTAPFFVAAAGAALLTLCAWRPLARGFATA
ncbi:MAG: MFS transporter, partial [Pseudomonadota bacterium]